MSIRETVKRSEGKEARIISFSGGEEWRGVEPGPPKECLLVGFMYLKTFIKHTFGGLGRSVFFFGFKVFFSPCPPLFLDCSVFWGGCLVLRSDLSWFWSGERSFGF